METPETIAPAEAATTPDAAARALPWVTDRPAPAMPPAETLHWGMVAFTVLTAIMILLQAYGGSPSAPRELLPIVIDAR